MVAGSKPIRKFERPLDDRPPGKALFRLGNERTTVIVQPGIRLHEGSATAARHFEGRSERDREVGRGWGFGGGNWGLWSRSQAGASRDKRGDVHKPLFIVA
jgi:hypothetical protein